jgi:hypothetical protein
VARRGGRVDVLAPRLGARDVLVRHLAVERLERAPARGRAARAAAAAPAAAAPAAAERGARDRDGVALLAALHPPRLLLLDRAVGLREELVVARRLVDRRDHRGEEGRLRAPGEALLRPRAIQEEAERLDQVAEVFDHPARRLEEPRAEEAEDDEVGVPILRLAEAAAGDDKRVRLPDERVALRVREDVVRHVAPKLAPEAVDVEEPRAEL